MNSEDLSIEKVPPQSLEAEMSALGSMLLSQEALYRGIEILEADFFYKDAHKIIFQAIVKLFEKDEVVDVVTVAEQLKRDGNLEKTGGASYLVQLVEMVPTPSNIDYYAKIVRDKAVLRSMIRVAGNIIARAYEEPDDVEGFVDEAEQMIFSVTERAQREDFAPISDLVYETMEQAERLLQNKRLVTGVPSGFIDFDMRTSGFQPSELIIIAGRPSMGKTAFVLNVALNASLKAHVPTAIFSMEMSGEQVTQRLLCTLAKVNLKDFRTGFLGDRAFKRLVDAAGELAEAPIFIDDTGALSVLELRAKARRLKARENIGLIIIDYLQLMRGRGRAENRQQEISEISRSLKALAKELNVPVIAVSQLSREVEKRGRGARPQLSDLRESGAIEQDADLVAFIHRPSRFGVAMEEGLEEMDEELGHDDIDVAEVIIGKQRNGPVGIVKLGFQEEFTRFVNLTPEAP